MKIQVCTGGTCRSRFSEYIIKRLENDKQKFSYKDYKVEESLCMGQCKKGPNVKINNGDVKNYSDPAKISTVVRNEITKKK